jgi:hypothetical protein
MIKILSLLASCLLILSSGKTTGNQVKTALFYGQNISQKSAPSLDQITKDFSKFEGKEVVFDAKVGKVCVKKGCWMTLENKNGSTRVKFKDYGFFVPISLVGSKVRVLGILNKKTLSVTEAKHYQKDAGIKNPKVTKPIVEYSIIATGVKKI